MFILHHILYKTLIIKGNSALCREKDKYNNGYMILDISSSRVEATFFDL